jgi:hypothetical protein
MPSYTPFSYSPVLLFFLLKAPDPYGLWSSVSTQFDYKRLQNPKTLHKHSWETDLDGIRGFLQSLLKLVVRLFIVLMYLNTVFAAL